jgi:probable rRNA maturation factor
MAKCWVGFDGFGLDGVDEEYIHFVFDVIVSMTKMKEGAEVGVVLCDDDFIQDLNKKYRGKDYVPNVLTFVYGEIAKDDFIGDDDNYLGDVYICKSQVKKGADELGVTLKDEFARLFVHGVLHLQGMEHDNDVKATEMEELEDKILSQILSVG